ncbi:hypothetical protein BX600DRAFT_279657 [Xylariales sp. PMI_506]|nr:hypothetical protein BX600DRAFT_279657 [Xylariales sp. PMI_506]
MFQFKAKIIALPQAPSKPEGKRLRRKLQKLTGFHRFQSTPSTTTVTVSPTTANNVKLSTPPSSNSSALAVKRSTLTKEIPRAKQGTLVAPDPDLSDAKWAEYLRSSVVPHEVIPKPMPVPIRTFSPPINIIPEFSHLAIEGTPPRKSFETSSLTTGSTASTPVSVGSSLRRYAKTPVSHIGQLEASSNKKQLHAAKRMSSVELIAESYRALLDSRCSFVLDRNSILEAVREEPQDVEPPRKLRPISTIGSAPVETVLEVPLRSKPDSGTPTSDAGTLIGFEEDAIYFKPVSFSPIPPSCASPTPERQQRQQQQQHQQWQPDHRLRDVPSIVSSLAPDNPSLQICVDLLTKELSSAVSGNLLRPSSETSTLQVWIMIEAYEKLRDRIPDMSLDRKQARSMEAMLDTWLKTLYAIHDVMTGNDGRRSESDYGD